MSKVTLIWFQVLTVIAKKNDDGSWLKSSDSYEKGVAPTEEEVVTYQDNRLLCHGFTNP